MQAREEEHRLRKLRDATRSNEKNDLYLSASFGDSSESQKEKMKGKQFT